MSVWTRTANRLLQALFPLTVMRSYQALSTESWLADAEADHDNWEPDELWAAQQRFPAGSTPSEVEHPMQPGGSHHTYPPRLRVVPPAVDAMPARVSRVGGRHSKPDQRTDEEVIEELVADYREFLKECFAKKFRN